MSSNWIAVASADHVGRGRKESFIQVCHGKAHPLGRLHPGDRLVYYSPTHEFRGKDRLQAFTAIGIVRQGEPYQFDMGKGFRPFRRSVDWVAARDAPIQPLLDTLEFTAGVRNWGHRFRFGLLAISDRDVRTIAEAMRAELAV